MKVVVIFKGAIQQHIGHEEIHFDLQSGAVFGDLLDEIGLWFGHQMSAHFWDKDANTFKAGIKAAGTDRFLESRSTHLKKGEKIRIMPALAGG